MDDVRITDRIVIPAHEIDITASRSGGAGGQHVNKTSSRVTVRWNVPETQALTDEEKQRVQTALASKLTTTGDLIIHHDSSRSQIQNRERACELLADMIRAALYVPKKRRATRVPSAVRERRLQSKSSRSTVKKLRSKPSHND